MHVLLILVLILVLYLYGRSVLSGVVHAGREFFRYATLVLGLAFIEGLLLLLYLNL